MRRWVVLLGGLAGCSFSPSPVTGDAAPLIDAPTGGDAPTPDAPVADPDPDGDGVPDSTDNCPAKANADQHDEDADHVGDLCDPCPQLASATLDADGDGVGDACDPHPAAAGDVLLRFETFAAALPTDWVATPGNATDWTVATDDLTIDLANTSNARFLVFDTTALHTQIDLGFTISAHAATSPAITAFVDEDAPGNNAMACSTRVGGGPGPGLYLESFASGFFTTVSQANETPAVPGSYRTVAAIDGASMRCDLTTAGGSHPLSTVSVATRTRVGIRVRDLTVQIHYIAIYTSP